MAGGGGGGGGCGRGGVVAGGGLWRGGLWRGGGGGEHMFKKALLHFKEYKCAKLF